MKWCAYCQKFQGEVPPYSSYAITHGICRSCAAKGLNIPDEMAERLQILIDIQKALFEAGSAGDAAMAQQAVAKAKTAGVRNVDLLMGVIAPLLWEVGDQWEKGLITVADEHRFTAFYDAIVQQFEDPGQGEDTADVVLVNAPGNTHYLGLRVLHLWLSSYGIKSVILKKIDPGGESAMLEKLRPKFLGISVATDAQLAPSLGLFDKIRQLPGAKNVHLIIGGGVIKRGNFENTDEITFLSDVDEFLKLLNAGQDGDLINPK